MRRYIVLDTETTGLSRRSESIANGHRIIEVGAVRVVGGKVDDTFHEYINPRMEVSEAALKIHGIGNRFLNDKPAFGDIVHDLLDFIGNDVIVMHNAPFDIAFLNKEFQMLSLSSRPNGRLFTYVDTLALARQWFPGRDNTLQALCYRFGIDGVVDHGALTDAIMLTKVFEAWKPWA